MKTGRCSCDRQMYPKSKTGFKLQFSDGTCDVYGCPGYINEVDSEWTYSTSPQRPYTKYHNPPSRNSRKAYFNQSALHYFSDKVGKSSINGLSNVFSSTKAMGKFIWLLVFSSCMIGFVYQASHFYSLYKTMPSVVQIEVENDGEVDFPAVTVCNTNRIRKSVFCGYYPERCKYGNDTLAEYEINELLYQLLLDRQRDLRKSLGHTKKMFVSCDFIGTPTVQEKECLNIWESYYDPDYGNCFTFTSKLRNDTILQARKVDFWQEENDLTLVLDVQPEEFMERRRNPGLIVVIHDEKVLPDIHTEGLYLSAGISYTITVSKSTVILLPLPYKTNCTDYLSLPWRNLSPRRLTSRMCTVGCSQYFQLKKCQFVTKNLSLFYETLPFNGEDNNGEKLKCAQDEEIRTVNYCRSICGLPCRDTVYVPTVATSRISGKEFSEAYLTRQNHTNMTLYDFVIHARIFYSTLEHKIYRHMPKYNTMEFFSFLGGYSGVWLGFSLLTIYELLDILVSTAIFLFKKKINLRQHKKLVRTIMYPKKHSRTTVKPIKKKKYYH